MRRQSHIRDRNSLLAELASLGKFTRERRAARELELRRLLAILDAREQRVSDGGTMH